MSQEYWQIAAGDASRDYSDLFLRYGIAFAGSSQYQERLRKVQPGHVVLLKRGTRLVLAAGRVVSRNGRHGGEGDLPALDDIDGWSLPAYCFVDWSERVEHRLDKPLHQKAVVGLWDQSHRDLADKLLGEGVVSSPYPEFPVVSILGSGDLAARLHTLSRVPGAASELAATLVELREVSDAYYAQRWEDVREHEARAFLVVPLLRALGWPLTHMKLELPVDGGRIDLACFNKPYWEVGAACELLVETKRFTGGLDHAPGQAGRYAAAHPHARALVVTNGVSYKTYRRQQSGGFSRVPSAYLSLRRPTDRYHLDAFTTQGAVEALSDMVPSLSK